MKARLGHIIFFVFFLSFPYLLLSFHFDEFGAIDWDEFYWAIKNSAIQSLLSALGSFLFGILLFRGLCRIEIFSGKISFYLKALVLLPSLFPPLYSVLIFLNLLQPFPTGFIGISILHSFINMGLVAVVFMNIFDDKLAQYADFAYVEGAGVYLFFKAVFKLIWKELGMVFIFIFVSSFTSFSIPLLVGGGMATTLEILIFEKLRIAGDFNLAVGLANMQFVLLAIFSFFPLPNVERKPSTFLGRKMISSNFGGLFLILYALGPILYFCFQSISGIEHLLQIEGLWNAALESLPFSLLSAFGVGVFTAILFIGASYYVPNPMLFKMVTAMTSPSTALLGFSLLFLGFKTGIGSVFLWTLGSVVTYFPVLFRWRWNQELSSLQDQVVIAGQLGASDRTIFLKIILPQILPAIGWVSGVSAFWAIGDFSIGKILFESSVTLSLLIESLTSSYRTLAAISLFALLLLLGGILILVFKGLADVCRRALIQKI